MKNTINKTFFFLKLSIWHRQTQVSGFSKILAAALRRRCARRKAAEESSLLPNNCCCDALTGYTSLCISSSLHEPPLHSHHRSSHLSKWWIKRPSKRHITLRNQTLSLWNSYVCWWRGLLNPSTHSLHIHHVVCLLFGGFKTLNVSRDRLTRNPNHSGSA